VRWHLSLLIPLAMEYNYHDTWDGTRYLRQIEYSTLKIVLQHDTTLHGLAAAQLTMYCSSFPQTEAPIVIGRGCHNIWRPSGFAANGTRELYALEVYSPQLSRNMFALIFGRTVDLLQHVPGEVVVYGSQNQEIAVCVQDGYGGEKAVPLWIYGPGELSAIPTTLPRTTYSTTQIGINLLLPVWGLVVALSEWVRCKNDLAYYLTAPQEWRSQLENKQRRLYDDIWDFRYYCFSLAKAQGTNLVAYNDPLFQNARQDVEIYLRSFTEATYVRAEAERETASDQFVTIGLLVALIKGPIYERSWM